MKKDQRGITGQETAIILIAFVVVASVFAFTVLSTGIFSSEQAKEAVHAGLGEARSSLEPRGSLTAFTGKLSDSTQTVYKMRFVVTSAVTDEPVDLTPPHTADGSGTDPDLSSGAEYSLVVSYSDDSQRLSDLPWTVNWVGFSNGDNILDPGKKGRSPPGSWTVIPARASARTVPSP